MSADKTEYKKIQGEILKLLFDNASATTFRKITELTKKPESETQYHCDALAEQGFIKAKRVLVGTARFADGYEITALGRKAIMEQ